MPLPSPPAPSRPHTGSAAPTTRPLRDPEGLSPRMRTRRAITLLLLTLVLPGSAQYAAGNKRVGRAAMRVAGAGMAAVALAALGWFVKPHVVLGLLTTPIVLSLLAVLLWAMALAWPALVIDAWRLCRWGLLPTRTRAVATGLAALLAVLTFAVPLAAGRRAWAAGSLISGVFGAGEASSAVDGRYTVLLLGGDAGKGRVGLRPDSITLASIDADTGRTVLFSLPRNLENVPFPAGSAAARELPDGWSCGDECLLNGLYTWGTEHRALFPGAADPGAEAMKQAVEGITGLPVNYYVMIDLAGFQRLIDAIGGIDVRVGSRVPIGGGTSPVVGHIEPGKRHLNGYRALWYARSREGGSDYDRMARQRCVMTAMLNQLDPTTVLTRFQRIAKAGRGVVRTDLPSGELPTFIELGRLAKQHRVTSVQFVPPAVRPAFPDYGQIRARVATAIESAGRTADAPARPPREGKASSQAAPSAAATPSVGATPSPDGEDTRAVCRAG